MWKKAVLFGLLAPAVFSLSSAAQSPGAKKNGVFGAGKWQIEFQGGWQAAHPRHLNMFPQYYQKTVSFLILDSYSYKKQVYGANYIYTVSPDSKNAFEEIKNAFPFGVNIRYHLSPRFDISLGLSYLSQKASSFYRVSIETLAIPPDSYGTWGLDDIDVRDLTYDETSISVRSWMPSAGIHYRLLSAGALSAEVYATAGPVFASIRHGYHSFDKFTFPDGFWFAWEYRNLYAGKGVGIGLSGGGRLGWNLSSRFELFATAGYSYSSIPKLTGSLEVNDRYVDVESEPPEFTHNETSGTWYFYSAGYRRNWGSQVIDVPAITTQPPQQSEKFQLHLSGLRLQAGIAIKL
jgi:hypothetical protein